MNGESKPSFSEVIRHSIQKLSQKIRPFTERRRVHWDKEYSTKNLTLSELPTRAQVTIAHMISDLDAKIANLSIVSPPNLTEHNKKMKSFQSRKEFLQKLLDPATNITILAVYDKSPIMRNDQTGGQDPRWLVVNYRVGEGGMGQVFKGVDLKLADLVAFKADLKCIKNSEMGKLNPEFKRQFQAKSRMHAEAMVTAKASPYGVKVLDVISLTKRNQHVMVTEWLDDQTNYWDSEEIKNLPLDSPHLFKYLREFAAAISYAANHNLLHFDLKPEHIIVTDDHVRLLDFGLAAPLLDKKQIQKLVIGTPPYLNPESATNSVTGLKSGLVGEVFTMAGILWEGFFQEHPFQGKGYEETLKKIKEFKPTIIALAKPEQLIQLKNLGIDANALQVVFDRALHKQPSQRYQSPEEFVEDLIAVLSSAQVESQSKTLENPSRTVA